MYVWHCKRSNANFPYMGRPPKNDLPADLAKWLHQIGVNVQSFRKEAGLSLAELAKRSKVSVTTINEIESRRFRDIRMSTIVGLARGLDISPLLLLRTSDIKLKSSDQSRLLKAGEDILRITKKIIDHD